MPTGRGPAVAVFDTVAGLPVHALVVHAVVVLLPLAAAGAIAVAVVPRWRQRFGTLLVLLTTVAVALVPVATRSGLELKERINAGGPVARQIRDHQAVGELVIWPSLALWVLTLALVVLSRRQDRRRIVTAVAVLTVAAGLASGAVVVRAGHLGSTAVWACTIGSNACR